MDYVIRRVDPLQFAPSANRTQCEQLEIHPDLTYEDDETFEIHLSSSTNRIVFLPQKTTVTILDNDCKQLGNAPRREGGRRGKGGGGREEGEGREERERGRESEGDNLLLLSFH